ncbi:glutaredoxin [Francisella halioticida]|uniref:Glutaredoxin n=1 Tax=Francisella halioticida TaxID=549298 RepID=A0ABN5B3W3_9GAMM|nr:Grx4 family monothiol glutaredoxin [Francisella halioticida]ASG68800.1 monothiol glutaredoxin, Grx4 family [Francisella halioticida]BCD91772.1 glutaredoxin [Francisella halioticida]
MYTPEEQKVVDRIEKQIKENDIILYMKGSPNLPQCGFSAHTATAIRSCGKPFAFVNILENPDIRAILPKYADWPTFPQLWAKGELVGGCDIIMEMKDSGELQELIDTIK